MFPQTVHFMTDAILHFQLHTALTHSLSVSPLSCSLPHSVCLKKKPGIHFQVIIERNKLFDYTLLSHLEVAYNKLPNALSWFSSQC